MHHLEEAICSASKDTPNEEQVTTGSCIPSSNHHLHYHRLVNLLALVVAVILDHRPVIFTALFEPCDHHPLTRYTERLTAVRFLESKVKDGNEAETTGDRFFRSFCHFSLLFPTSR